MNKYEVYWKTEHIGTLLVDGDRHKYEVIHQNIQKLIDKPLVPEVLCSRDWGEPIPFFVTRLEAYDRFPNLDIGFQTDNYRLKKI